MEKPITPALKMVFLIHAVVGLILGLAYLVFPATVTDWLDFPLTDEPYLRIIGAAILGWSATSLVAYRAQHWDEVKIIVQGELVWTGLAAVLMLWFLLDGVWPAAGWINFALMALFFLAFGYTYYREERTLTTPRPAPRT
jgi:hypothetical protein